MDLMERGGIDVVQRSTVRSGGIADALRDSISILFWPISYCLYDFVILISLKA